jgi:hypothetical protein
MPTLALGLVVKLVNHSLPLGYLSITSLADISGNFSTKQQVQAGMTIPHDYYNIAKSKYKLQNTALLLQNSI